MHASLLEKDHRSSDLIHLALHFSVTQFSQVKTDTQLGSEYVLQKQAKTEHEKASRSDPLNQKTNN